MLDREDALLTTLAVILIAAASSWKLALPVATLLALSAYLRHRYVSS